MSSWKIASNYIIGQGHISKNIPCQDRTYKLVDKKFLKIKVKRKFFKNKKRIKINKYILNFQNSFYGLSLADGAGSCKYSDIGAELVTKKILEYLNKNFEILFKDENIRLILTNYIENELQKVTTDNITFKT